VVDSGQKSSEKVPLLSREEGVGVDIGIEVSSEQSLDESRLHDLLRLHVRQLDPVANDILGDPENSFIDSLASQFLLHISGSLLSVLEIPVSHPVVIVLAEDLSEELDIGSARHLGQSVERLLDQNVEFFSEPDSSPLQDVGALEVVLHGLVVGVYHGFHLGLELGGFLIQQFLDLVYEVDGLFIGDDGGLGIDLVVELRVLDLEVCFLYEGGDLLELVEGIIGVVHEDAIEHFSQVGE
jgi:hypothetical protein